jgi:hypothetical protein
MKRSTTNLMMMAGSRRGWNPPDGTDVWWYGDSAVSGGGLWVDKIVGKTITIDADCSVVPVNGLVLPSAHTGTGMQSNYTPVAGSLGTGLSVSWWLWADSITGLSQIIWLNNSLYLYYYRTPFHVFQIAPYNSTQTLDIFPIYGPWPGWNHFSITEYYGDGDPRTGQHAELYVNGVLKANLTVGSNAELGAFRIISGTISGKMTDIMVARRCLSVAEVVDIKDNSPGRPEV